MRILTIISGILMVLTGAFCLMNPGQTFLSLAFVVGLIMVLNGLIHALAYFIGRGLHNRGDNNGWILTDALLTLLLGILILCNQLVAGIWLVDVSGGYTSYRGQHSYRQRTKTFQFQNDDDNWYPDSAGRALWIHKSAGSVDDDGCIAGYIPGHAGCQCHRAGNTYAT